MSAEKYHITTFGCQTNVADSERMEGALKSRGMVPVVSVQEADYVVINTCMVRESAENRVYGMVHNLGKQRMKTGLPKKIVVTGCMVGGAVRDKTGKAMKLLRDRLPTVDEFLPIDEVGFANIPERAATKMAYIPISNGCNNYCSFCIVPYTRGPEISRPMEDVLAECQKVWDQGFSEVMLLGQNVNSYGADLVKGEEEFSLDGLGQEYLGQTVKPVIVKHLGRLRIPTLFPYLLDMVAKLGFSKIDFFSSNPWDFSDELIDVIARNASITRTLHLPVQSGDDAVLKQMNRWYTVDEYFALIEKIRSKIDGVEFTTDIIVGFPGESDEAFENTVRLCEQVGFSKAFVARYSPRPYTKSAKTMENDVAHEVKKERWLRLDKIVNAYAYL
ncbi:MAG: MiaB/RimO family radical SAM methylthiotransferase [bacterium]